MGEAQARTVTLVDEDGRVVCGTCELAESALRRMRGLLGRSGLGSDEGLLLRPAPSIHTFFMRFPIDAVFLDRDLVVLDAVESLRPWRTAGRRGARAVLELPAGAVRGRGIVPGKRLRPSKELCDEARTVAYEPGASAGRHSRLTSPRRAPGSPPIGSQVQTD